jgi:3-oxoacyl-[acyl-carrier protein] reductase
MNSSDARVAVVTGAGGGLGSAVAQLLGDAGTRVAMVDVDADALGDAATRVPGSVPFTTDLANADACEALIPSVLERLGRVDILVNCAAILARRSLDEATPEYFDHVYAINARAPYFLMRAALRDMAPRGWGRIVNVTSTGVYAGGMNMTSAVYESSKGSVAVLTKMFAKAGARDGVLVNSLCPGGMRTRMLTRDTPDSVLRQVEDLIPLGRLAEPIEVARMIAWLVSDANSYATGATFDINGGLVMP